MTKAEIVSNLCDELGMDKLDVQTTVATDVATILSGGEPKYPVKPL